MAILANSQVHTQDRPLSLVWGWNMRSFVSSISLPPSVLVLRDCGPGPCSDSTLLRQKGGPLEHYHTTPVMFVESVAEEDYISNSSQGASQSITSHHKGCGSLHEFLSQLFTINCGQPIERKASTASAVIVYWVLYQLEILRVVRHFLVIFADSSTAHRCKLFAI